MSSYGAIDLHADTTIWMRYLRYDFTKRHSPKLPRNAWLGHVDLPRMLEGEMGGQFLGLVAIPGLDWGLYKTVARQAELVAEAIESSYGRMVPARSGADVRRAYDEGKVAALLGIEGAHSLEGDAENLDRLAARGARYLGLMHFSSNKAGFPAFGVGRDDTRGLTAWGRDLVARCDALGVIVDLAHINRKGFFETLEVTKNPVFVTHTGVAGVHPHWRNIDDEQVRAVAARQGAIGIIFAPVFLGRDGVEAVVDHIAHVVNVAGEDTPSLGSDWDGMVVPTSGLSQASELPNLYKALEKRFSSRVVDKIVRGNVLRVLDAVAPRCEGTGVWATTRST